MYREYTQIDVAVHQLETAIRLLVQEGDYFSSATLAGAAEEIFGSMLKDRGRENALSREIASMQELLTPDEQKA